MVDFVTLSNITHFSGNPIIEQHDLRYRSVIQRQNWKVPYYKGLEFDEYDNPAAKYLVYRNENGKALACSRFYPTHLPYMLEEKFSRYIKNIDVPKDEHIWEGSRLCVDHTLPALQRKEIIHYIVVSYLEMALFFNVKAIIGLMYPACWQSVFIKSGWEIKFIGDVLKLEDGHKAQAAWLPVSQEILNEVRKTTGIINRVTNFGESNVSKKAA